VTETDIRRLTYADLPQVIAIERRAFPAPWSLAMFVLELSKPGGVCLAALRGKRIVGYLVCSRYDTVWHVMNVAVDPDLQGEGIGSALLAKLIEEVGDERARSRSRSGARTPTRSASTSASASAPPACGAATTRTTARTRSSCGAPRPPCSGAGRHPERRAVGRFLSSKP
jgi:GNAT superfamily N-acetyltransferase